MVHNRLKVLVPSCATLAVVAIVVGMVGTYFTSAVGVVGMDQFAHEVHQGAQEVRIMGAQLAQIIDQVQTLSPRFDTVHAGMQAQGAQQISAAMAQLRDTAQQTMASWQASTRAITQLSEASQSLHHGG
jgi:methyl-accepting chemotaxis protein WspA